MKERPIIFSAPMVRAILNGSKTQTRRVVRPQPGGRLFRGMDSRWYRSALADERNPIRCPYGVPGDRLWVRETWAAPHSADHFRPAHIPHGARIHYSATEDRGGLLWRPSIHMPRLASRITLEIVSVRVERLQEISEEDALAEGALEFDGPTTFVDDGMQSIYFPNMGYARAAFIDLWDSINAKRAPWSSNPWVWVIEFRRAGE